MSIKFSIIIPAYNAEKYILKALNSVKNQTYKNIELVIINDGSTDKTENIIQGFIEQNEFIDIKYISIKNSGLANARNIGINSATGDYFCNLDSDDFLDENTLENISKLKDSFDVCYYGYKDIDEETGEILSTYDDRFNYTTKNISGVEATILKLKKYLCICQGNAIYDLNMIKKNNIYNIKGIDQGEDFYFIIRALLHAKNVVCIPKNHFNCTVRRSSMMHSKFNKTHPQILIAIEKLISDVEKYEFLKEIRIEIIDLIKAEYLNAQAGIAKKIFEEFNFSNYRTGKKVYLQNKYKEITSYNEVKYCFNKRKKVELFVFTHSLFSYFCLVKIYYLKNKFLKI